MDKRRFILEAGTIVLAAVFCALVANALASRERSLALVGDYPAARSVPPHAGDPFAPTVASTQTMSSTQTVSTMTGSSRPSGFDPPVTATAMSASSGGMAESGAPLAGNAPMTTTAPSASSRPAQPASTAAPNGKRSVPAASPLPAGTPPSHGKVGTPAAGSSGTLPSSAQSNDLLARFSPHEKVPYVEISGDDVTWLHQHGALFLDARRTSVYEQGHIAGARPFSVWESDVDDKVKALLAENRDQKQPIVVYCSGGDCEDSHMLAQKLWGVFFNNVYVYKDGFPDWQKRGGPSKSGGQP
jgi:rhodanese-related sulfurtransferase